MPEISENNSEMEEFQDAIAEDIKDINIAITSKEEGNLHYKNKNYDEAIEAYSKAITYCPLDEDNKSNLAMFYGNRSAAFFAEEEYEQVVDDCTSSLELKPDHVKIIARRMMAFEKLVKMEEALSDAKKVKELEPLYPKINDTIQRYQIAYDEKMNKMKDDALGKLKELGNTILGNFGMSLDNFKMAQDPGTGSWNISVNK